MKQKIAEVLCESNCLYLKSQPKLRLDIHFRQGHFVMIIP